MAVENNCQPTCTVLELVSGHTSDHNGGDL